MTPIYKSYNNFVAKNLLNQYKTQLRISHLFRLSQRHPKISKWVKIISYIIGVFIASLLGNLIGQTYVF